MPASLENSPGATGLENVIPIPRKDNAKEYWDCCTIALISHANKVMLKIRQARLQQFSVNWEFQTFKLDSKKGRVTRDRIANIRWIIEKARQFKKKKKIYLWFIDYTKAFHFVDHNKLGNSSRDGDTRPPDLPPVRPICRLRHDSYNQTWNDRLDQNWEKNTSRLYIVTLLI